tara:strand:+ start:543 stop:1133 length:591 start_codon:yes stop_codon:yes gene_type:complete
MDGVLVDFVSSAVNDINKFLDNAASVEKDFLSVGQARAYRRILKEVGPDFRASCEDDLQIKSIRNLSFFLIGRDPGKWFSKLGKQADGVELLWPFLTNCGRTVRLLTAGVSHRSGTPAESGKIIWAERELEPAAKELICTMSAEKQNYATTDGVPNILIDDRARTIKQWKDAGGIGILHVTGQSKDTISRLKKLGL